METLEHLRHRLETMTDLRGLVRTMKALAAVSIHQNEQAVRALAVYWRTVELGLHVVLRDLPARPRAEKPADAAPLGLVLFGSDHGMCGRFNDEIAEQALQSLTAPRRAGAPLRVLAVGARAAMRLAQEGLDIEATQPVPASTTQITGAVRQMLLTIDRWRDAGTQRVWLVFNHPVSSSRYEPSTWHLLPVDFERFASIERQAWESRRLPTFTMERGALLAALLRQYFFAMLFRACAESLASENSARLMAMQSAEKNLEERSDELTGEFRRRRQDQITAELLDVVSGYEAIHRSSV